MPLSIPPLPSLSAPIRRRAAIHAETLALGLSLFFALAGNRLFWANALQGRDLAQAHNVLLALGLLGLLTTLNFLLTAPFLTRRTFRPLLGLLCLANACAIYYIDKFGVYLDPGMLRNVLHTDFKEARELFAWDMLPYLTGYALLPWLVLSRVELRDTATVPRTIMRRAGAMLLAVILCVALLLLAFQDFASLMRGNKELRYLITPANYLYSLARVVSVDVRAANRPTIPVGEDAHLGAAWQERKKPMLLVMIVGETARAANWGLSGYARQTTPELAALNVLNFPNATSCGTSTEVSVPCMFSAIGRRDYDEERIRDSESLLHVLNHAGIGVSWHDNQSGCKGVCKGLPQTRPDPLKSSSACVGDHCFDAALLDGLDDWLATHPGNQVLVLHMLGNHGPAYHLRYPAAFRRFTPTCDTDDLGLCNREQIVNSYDNALLYTDHVLAQAIAFLRGRAATHDTALLYASDHGESLGENGVYLHGIPYPIAPDVQTRIPLLLWLSPGYAADFKVDTACLAARAKQPASHDHLFHTVLGLLDVNTKAYAPEWDLLRTCRN